LVKLFSTAKKEKSFRNGKFYNKNLPFFIYFCNLIEWKQRDIKSFIRRLIIDGILDEEIVTYQFTDPVTQKVAWKCSGRIRFGFRWPISEVCFCDLIKKTSFISN
jgi:hypothetical protein